LAQGGGPIASQDFGERIGASAAAAQALQGPLDGAWSLVGPDNRTLFVFEFIDPPGGKGPLNGAWRDPNRPSGAEDGGVFTRIARTERTVRLAFPPPGGRGGGVALHRADGGMWAGRLSLGGIDYAVRLRRGVRASADKAAARAVSKAAGE
jgi:hypothetical protein